MLPEDLGDDLTATLWAQEGHPVPPVSSWGSLPTPPTAAQAGFWCICKDRGGEALQ